APQNVPGTRAERPNWRRKARLSFEELSTPSEVVENLERVDPPRKGAARGKRTRPERAAWGAGWASRTSTSSTRGPTIGCTRSWAATSASATAAPDARVR